MANTNKMADGSKVYLNEFDLSGALNTWDFSASRTIADTRTFSGNDYTAGSVIDPTCSFSGWAVYGTDLYDEEMHALITSEVDSTAGAIFGGTAGDVAYEVVGKVDADNISATVGSVNTVAGGIMGEWFARGLALDVASVESATGGNTGQNVGVVTSGYHVLIARVTAVDTLTTASVEFEGSSDDGSGDAYAKLTGYTWSVGGNCTESSDTLSFTGTGYAIGYKLTTSEAWVRTNVTVLTGTSITLSSMAGEGIALT